MSLVNNIHAHTIMRAASGQSAHASASVKGAETGSLEDFIGAVLQQVNKAEAATKNTKTQQTETAGPSTDVQEAVEKVAARLNIDPKDPKAAEKITDALSSIADGADPALTSDLSSEFATIIQAVDDSSHIDDDMLSQIEDALQGLMDNPDMTPEQLAAFSDNLVKDLKAKGIPDATILEYIDTLNLPIGEQAAALSPPASDDALSASLASLVPAAVNPFSSDAAPSTTDMPMDGTDKDVAAPLLAAVKAAGTGDFSSELPADTAADVELPMPQQVVAPKKHVAAKPDVSADAAKIDAVPAPEVKADATPKAVPTPKAEAQTSTLALVNAMASGDDNYTQQQMGVQNNDLNSLQSMMGLRGDAAQNNMINYFQPDQKMAASTIQMIAIQMQQNAANKSSTFSMQLEPADLGRLDIEMTFEKSGGVKAHVSAERPETLSMLQRDSHQLNRILQQAGLDVDDGGLTFDLRQETAQQDNSAYGQDGRGRSAAYNDGYKSGSNMLQAQIAANAMGYVSQSGVNIMV